VRLQGKVALPNARRALAEEHPKIATVEAALLGERGLGED